MPRRIVWHREWSTPILTACCAECGWQWTDRGKLCPMKLTAGLRLANAAEKHVECLGHHVITSRVRLLVPGKRIRAARAAAEGKAP